MTTHESLMLRTRDFTLASLAAAYPNEEASDALSAMRPEIADHAGLSPMMARLGSGLDALRADYLRRFDHGQARVPLYETEYGRMRGLSKGKDLADITGFYTAFGFELSQGAELPDHLAVEMEFYALLLYKQSLLSADPEGVSIVEDARRKFLAEHLGTFAAAVAERPAVAGDAVYGPLLRWCAELITRECQLEGVSPAPLDFFADKEGDEPSNCGGCVSIPGLSKDL